MAKKNAKEPAKSGSGNREKSVKIQFTTRVGSQTVKLPKTVATARAPGALLQTFFGRMTPDPNPDWNIVTVTGLPEGTRVASAWVTEWIEGNFSHAGGAIYNTASVQLFDRGTKCRVRFHLYWDTHLPSGVMIIFGP